MHVPLGYFNHFVRCCGETLERHCNHAECDAPALCFQGTFQSFSKLSQHHSRIISARFSQKQGEPVSSEPSIGICLAQRTLYGPANYLDNQIPCPPAKSAVQR